MILLYIYIYIRVFLKGHFEKKIKCPPHHITGGYLGRSYPEGEADQTSLGGCRRHLKFDKIDRAAEFCIGSAAVVLNAK